MVRWMLRAIILFTFSAGNLYATGEKFRPSERHYAAVQKREECSVRRAVYKRVRRERSEKAEVLADVQATLKERRIALEQCAAANGFSSWSARSDVHDGFGWSEDEDVYVAQVCQEQYDLWLTPGYHIEIVERELHELDRNSEKLSNFIASFCNRPNI